MISLPVLLALTLGAVVVRARRPRPSWRRVMRQPGATACLVALVWFTLAVAVLGGVVALIYLKPGSDSPREPLGEIAAGILVLLTFCTAPVAASVLVSWLVMAIQRGWRCERSWIDRFGWLLGCGWMLIGAAIGVELLRSAFFE